MGSEFEHRLQTLCRKAETELPAAAFQAGVMARIRSRQRRDALLQGIGYAASAALLWLLFPQIGSTLEVVATSLAGPLDWMARLPVTLAKWPITYVYGSAFVGYLLLRFHHRISLI
jgi:hypothetical protein